MRHRKRRDGRKLDLVHFLLAEQDRSRRTAREDAVDLLALLITDADVVLVDFHLTQGAGCAPADLLTLANRVTGLGNGVIDGRLPLRQLIHQIGVNALVNQVLRPRP